MPIDWPKKNLPRPQADDKYKKILNLNADISANVHNFYAKTKSNLNVIVSSIPIAIPLYNLALLLVYLYLPFAPFSWVTGIW